MGRTLLVLAVLCACAPDDEGSNDDTDSAASETAPTDTVDSDSSATDADTDSASGTQDPSSGGAGSQGCEPDCSGRQCGPDPVCGESCGTCDEGTCSPDGQCQMEVSVVIDFDDLASESMLDPSAYPNVTIETNPGNDLYVASFAGQATSPPNYVWGGESSNELAELHLLFDTPVSNLSFKPVCLNSSGTVGQVVVHYVDGSTQMQDLVGSNPGTACHANDIVGLNEQDIIEVHVVDIDDQYGIGWDDISFSYYE